MEFINSLWKYVVTSAPYLMLGFLLAGLIKALISDEQVKRWLGGNSLWAVIKASIIGVPLPLCSCSVIPTAVSLKKSGASNASTSAFLISTPESGVDSISITYALMDLPMTIFRPIAAFMTATVAGILQLFFNKENYKDPNGPTKSCCSCHEKVQVATCCDSKPKATLFIEKLWQGVKYALLDLMEDMSFWLAIGLISGALIDFLVPAEFFGQLNGFWGRVVILAIGIPLYICASASTPIAASLVMKGLSPGTALLFLLVGPATNISSIFVLQKYIGKKGVIINVATICVVAFILSYVVDWIYLYFAMPVNFKVSEHVHEDHTGIFSIILSILFLSLLIRGIYLSKIKPIFEK
ncbi:MAG: hypothetical protein A2202_02475 [Bdellovibrionales bacterium RIFOXYA1_FULL_36_14]|nr:MAG: hypothetical protein A2202_02475 [Bdellovibrionales bacterium RIFOXYA1_FULL_36_14]